MLRIVPVYIFPSLVLILQYSLSRVAEIGPPSKVNFKVPLISWAKTVGIGDIVMLQRQILQSQEFDFRTLNAMKIKEKSNEIMKLENLLSLDEKITQKYAEITATYKIQLMNGTITAYDYIKQQNDELQSLINKEMHNMQLLKAKFEMLALQGRL